MAETRDPAEWLGRVSERGGRLLRTTVDRAAGGGLSTLAFTFDVGTVALRAADGDLIGAAHPAGQGEAGTNADEDDPWWTVLGNPLHRIHAHEEGLLLQFRADADSPKILLLRPEGDSVRVRTVA